MMAGCKQCTWFGHQVSDEQGKDVTYRHELALKRGYKVWEKRCKICGVKIYEEVYPVNTKEQGENGI